MSVNYFAQDNN